ncbi:unnamed protein product (macronuclear) [Paramecium tetraurelia]|uniref:Uncharacterized protein n=1 Tax=Paramecium tetraurelia TaxID=5888 RepID=A0C686_PARTE|nr:uncharacterized protein GSPATT00035432001 [Paramecium tetraurelia]CAK66303.1 unnamed protein product [Paramecium tetraurelia]|eukprot:XP_001433700.1 hypothetical protein (macronuclear) [Paramecium tetraurelia strain d4-2]
MKDGKDLQFESQYDIVAKNICVCFQIERKVIKIQIFGDTLALEEEVIFSSLQEMTQTNVFNKNESQQPQQLCEDEQHLDEFLVRLQEERIREFLLSLQPLREVVLT